MPKKILLTGCAGFIGSHVLDRLLNDGHQVVGVDNFDPFYDRSIKEDNLSAHTDNPSFHLLEADLAEPTTYTKIKFIAEGLFGQESEDRLQATETENSSHHARLTTHHSKPISSGFDSIIHLAAKAGVRPSIEDPKAYFRANVTGTHNLLEFARDHSIRQFVFASSSSVYGVNESVPWKEDTGDLLPISPYAASKLSGEHLGHVYSKLFQIRFLALRFFTVYGPRQRPDLAIHKFAQKIQHGDAITMFGDGNTRRDYTYIDNIVDGVLASLEYDASEYEIINLGNDQTVELQDMIAQVEASMGIQADIERLPEQAGDVPQTWACIEKAKRLLGYHPNTRFEEGVQRFIEWFLESQPVAR